MTSKNSITISISPYNSKKIHLQKRNYSLRPLRPTRNVSTDDTKTRIHERKEKKFRNLESAVNVDRLATSVRNERKQLPIEDTVQELSTDSNTDVSQFLEDVDLTNFSDMEDDAFQLAEYLESNAFDASVHAMRLEAFLDMSIEELQMATSFNATNVAFQNSIPQQMNKKTRSIPVDTCNSKRIKMHAAETNKQANDRETGQLDAIDHINRSCKSTGNSSKRRRNTLSEAPKIFSVPAEPIIASERSERNRLLRNNPFKNTSPAVPNSTVIEHVPRTVPKPNSEAVPHLTPYTTLTKNVALKRKMTNLFNRTCYNYLNGRSSPRYCKWNHNLRSAHEISEKLMRLANDELGYMYFNFVLKSNMAFVAYFPTMCDVFGIKKMKAILLSAISHCEKRENIPFLKFIFNGLVTTGLSQRDALTTVTNYCCKNRDCYDVLLEIIVETGSLQFVDLLKEYYFFGTINTQSAYKLLQQVVDAVAAEDTSLLTVFIDILDSYSMYNGFDVETFTCMIPTVKQLVLGNLSLSQKLQHIASRY